MIDLICLWFARILLGACIIGILTCGLDWAVGTLIRFFGAAQKFMEFCMYRGEFEEWRKFKRNVMKAHDSILEDESK